MCSLEYVRRLEQMLIKMYYGIEFDDLEKQNFMVLLRRFQEVEKWKNKI